MKLLLGDCLDKLKELADNSVDSVVTDPPYEIGFMGKGWDDSGIANNAELWKEVLRVLKPGGHLLSFSHSRTYHRQAVAVEDAGFEIRDQIMWVYGSGFPKSMDISKQIDKKFGKLDEREVVGIKKNTYDGSVRNTDNHRSPIEISLYGGWGLTDSPHNTPQTAPATDEAK
jgi:site-specific DNA-methyltransferase (adenine-specific)